MSDDKTGLKRTIEDLRKVIAEKNAKNEELTEKITELEKQLAEKDAKIEELDKRIAEFEASKLTPKAEVKEGQPEGAGMKGREEGFGSIVKQQTSPTRILIELQAYLKKSSDMKVKQVLDDIDKAKDALENAQGTQRLCYAINQFSREIKGWYSRENPADARIKSNHLQKILDEIDTWIDRYFR